MISGEYEIKLGNTIGVLKPGDSYTIPANVEHSIKVRIEGEVIDVFTPARQDYF